MLLCIVVFTDVAVLASTLKKNCVVEVFVCLSWEVWIYPVIVQNIFLWLLKLTWWQILLQFWGILCIWLYINKNVAFPYLQITSAFNAVPPPLIEQLTIYCPAYSSSAFSLILPHVKLVVPWLGVTFSPPNRPSPPEEVFCSSSFEARHIFPIAGCGLQLIITVRLWCWRESALLDCEFTDWKG